MNRRKIITRVIVFLLLGAIVNVAVAWWCNLNHARERDRVTLASAEATERWRRHAPVAWPAPHLQGERVDHGTLVFYVLDVATDEEDFLIVEKEVGLPCRALRGARMDAFARASSSGWLLTERMLSGLVEWEDERFPLQPIWPGFAINTLFYAAILWLLFAAPFALRRHLRIKRDLCPACAYPIGKSDVCTECGKPVKVRSVEPQI